MSEKKIKDKLLSMPAAADEIGLSYHTIRSLCVAKKLRHMRMGPTGVAYRFRIEWLHEYLESCIVEPVNAKPKKTVKKVTPKPAARKRLPGEKVAFRHLVGK
tara:strand:- start:3876 stop:4181 length:306 start_codon:yes stop_codon:yes gene_type:complete